MELLYNNQEPKKNERHVSGSQQLSREQLGIAIILSNVTILIKSSITCRLISYSHAIPAGRACPIVFVYRFGDELEISVNS